MLDFLLHGFIKVTEPFYYKGDSLPLASHKEPTNRKNEMNEIKELNRRLFAEQEISAGLLRRALKAEQELKATNSILDEADTLIDALYASGDLKMTNEELVRNYTSRPVEPESLPSARDRLVNYFREGKQG